MFAGYERLCSVTAGLRLSQLTDYSERKLAVLITVNLLLNTVNVSLWRATLLLITVNVIAHSLPTAFLYWLQWMLWKTPADYSECLAWIQIKMLCRDPSAHGWERLHYWLQWTNCWLQWICSPCPLLMLPFAITDYSEYLQHLFIMQSIFGWSLISLCKIFSCPICRIYV